MTTALIIIAALIFLFLLLLNIPVTAYIRYYSGKLDLKVSYGFMSVFPKKSKKPEKTAEKETAKKNTIEKKEKLLEKNAEEKEIKKPAAEKTEKTTDESSEKKDNGSEESKDSSKTNQKKDGQSIIERLSLKLDSLTEKKNAVQLLIELCSKPVVKLLRLIRIDGLILELAPAGEDPYETAMLYGKLNIAVYNFIAFLKAQITVTIKSVRIGCQFCTPSEQSRYDGECKVRLRPASLVNAVFKIVFGYLFNMKKYSGIMVLINKDKNLKKTKGK